MSKFKKFFQKVQKAIPTVRTVLVTVGVVNATVGTKHQEKVQKALQQAVVAVEVVEGLLGAVEDKV